MSNATARPAVINSPEMALELTDFLVIGGGIVGLTTALEIRRRFPEQRVLVLEKEARLAAHASGRNSGVLHAGFYYTSDTLKARLTREGNLRMQSYCRSKGLPLNRCGKLVVASSEEDLSSLEILLERGAKNGVCLEDVSDQEAKKIEPRVKTLGRALWSPDTATVDPESVVESLANDCRELGIEVRTSCAYSRRLKDRILTDRGPLSAGYVINCAGLYADVVAWDFGFGAQYQILPFKGLFLYSSEPDHALRTNVYPVPNLRNPFLGVHFTVTVDGRHKIGPTAIPCLWRQQYGWFDHFRMSEACEAARSIGGLLLRGGFDFRGLATEEIRKYYRPYLVSQAARLLEGVDVANYRVWGRPGIRAQLLDRHSRKLVMDFVLEGDSGSFHVLNAVSPAFTCAFSFAETIVDRIQKCLA